MFRGDSNLKLNISGYLGQPQIKITEMFFNPQQTPLPSTNKTQCSHDNNANHSIYYHYDDKKNRNTQRKNSILRESKWQSKQY